VNLRAFYSYKIKGAQIHYVSLYSYKLIGKLTAFFAASGVQLPQSTSGPVGVDRGNEDASSLMIRAEHVTLLLGLTKAHPTQDLLYPTDSKSILKTISKWVGEGTRANLTTDLVREIVQILQERVTAGANTFLVKIKAHRGEPFNEEVDSRAEQDRVTHNTEDTNEHTPKLLWDLPSRKTIFSWTRTQLPGSHQQIPQILQRQDRRQTTT
jgi:ribonuclease HI